MTTTDPWTLLREYAVLDDMHFPSAAPHQWMQWTDKMRAALAEHDAQPAAPCGAICAGKVRDGLECSEGRCAVRESAARAQPAARPQDALDAQKYRWLRDNTHPENLRKLFNGCPVNDAQPAQPTLPIEIHGKLYDVPIPVQVHIVSLRMQLDGAQPAAQPQDALDAGRYRWLRQYGMTIYNEIFNDELAITTHTVEGWASFLDTAIDATMKETQPATIGNVQGIE